MKSDAYKGVVFDNIFYNTEHTTSTKRLAVKLDVHHGCEGSERGGRIHTSPIGFRYGWTWSNIGILVIVESYVLM